jgi:hypothetical protein
MAAWHADEATGSLEEQCLVLRWPRLGAQRELRVLEVQAGSRLVLESGAALVTFELDDNQLTLKHQGLTSSEEFEGTRSSWQVALAVLDHYLTHHFGKSRQVHWAAAPARFTADQAYAFFSHDVAPGAWLGQASQSLEGVGSTLYLSLSGTLQAVQVLASNPGRDVAMALLGGARSVLVMRTLPAPLTAEKRLVALTWSQWGHAPPDEQITETLDRAVVRLSQLAARAGSA